MNTADSSSVIRAAKREDAPALAALLVELGFPAPSDVVAARFEVFTGAGESVLVSAQDAEVLGLVTLHVTHVLHRPTPVGRITALVVAARARGHGIGRALMEAAEQLLAARGCALVEVTSHRDLVEAHAFYERLGYEATSFRFRKLLPPPPLVSTGNTTFRRRLDKIMPELPLADVAAGVAHYRDVLGFHVNYQQHDIGVMDRDKVRLLLIAKTEQHRGIGSCYVYVHDADALHAELVAKGAAVQGAPVSRPWGLREFRVLDPEGNQLTFGQPFE